jgi:hypothetical protein
MHPFGARPDAALPVPGDPLVLAVALVLPVSANPHVLDARGGGGSLLPVGRRLFLDDALAGAIVLVDDAGGDESGEDEGQRR